MLRENLIKIAEKANNKLLFNDDIKKFVSYILTNWLEKCAECANEGLYGMTLYSFRSDAVFENNKIKYFVKNGLKELLEEETQLSVSINQYILRKITRELVKTEECDFDVIEDKTDIFLHYYVIRLEWQKK